MKISYLQFSPVLGDPEKSIDRIDSLIGRCRGADLVVLPELANSGYNFTSDKQAWDCSETVGEGPFSNYLKEKAAALGCHLVAGINERDGNLLYNTAILVSPGGKIHKYRKMHLFWDEPDIYQPGNLGLPVFDIGKCKVGLLICFDWIFPEIWRVLALQGADLVCHPSNLVLPYCQQAVPVHALCNRIFVITTNRIGTEGDKTFTGKSIIAAPDGKVLKRATAKGEEVGSVKIDISLARDKMMTPKNHLFKDRRPQDYGRLTEKD